MKVSRAVRLAAYRDPEWRALAAADLEQSPMKPRWDTFEVSESQRFPELQGRRVSELAHERGCGPLDVMCEIAVAEDLTTRFRAYIANDDVDAVGHLLTHESVALGLSDAGAHIDQLCDAPLPTDLARHVGTGARGHAARGARCTSSRASRPTCSASCGAATCARATGPTCACSIPTTVGTGPDAARARLPGRRRAPHRRGADRCAARARERHADPRRRGAGRPARRAARRAAPSHRVRPASPRGDVPQARVRRPPCAKGSPNRLPEGSSGRSELELRAGLEGRLPLRSRPAFETAQMDALSGSPALVILAAAPVALLTRAGDRRPASRRGPRTCPRCRLVPYLTIATVVPLPPFQVILSVERCPLGSGWRRLRGEPTFRRRSTPPACTKRTSTAASPPTS